MEARSAVHRLEMELAVAKQRAAHLAVVVESLRALVDVDSGSSIGEETLDVRPAEAAASASGGPDTGHTPTDHPPTRVRSTELVAQVINTAAPHTMSRDDVLHAMELGGYTRGMKAPKNSINTALYRASQRGLIRTLDRDTFQAIDSSDTPQTPEGQTNLGLQDANEERPS